MKPVEDQCRLSLVQQVKQYFPGFVALMMSSESIAVYKPQKCEWSVKMNGEASHTSGISFIIDFQLSILQAIFESQAKGTTLSSYSRKKVFMGMFVGKSVKPCG